jgi:Histidine phosphatase superfamily (branch 2)
LHYYQYGALYNTSTKILARTTSQDRVLNSTENFMAGFFGLDWTKNATLEVIIEQPYFNNSLAGYFQCNNSNTYVSTGGNNANVIWENIYLKNTTARLKKLAGGYN